MKGKIRHYIKLVEKENIFSFSFRLIIKKLLIALLLILPFSAQGVIYAVLVGVSEYKSSANNLNYSHRDAIAMYELLKEHTTPERMILLTNAQASHDNIVYYTKRLFQQAQPDDIVIFYFSGHGNKDIFFAYDKVLYFKTLQSIFRQTKARRKLIFADACFSGTLRQSGLKTVSGNANQGSYADKNGLQSSVPAPSNNTNLGNNVLLFLSSRSNQYAQESSLFGNGAFTHFLLDGLKGDADVNHDTYITAKELFNFVYPKVREQTNNSQSPVMWGKFDENMIILKLNNN